MPDATNGSTELYLEAPVPSYESEDHSDIDRAINQARKREHAITRAHNSLASKRYAISAAIVLLALGALLVLAGIAWRVASPENQLETSWNIPREDIDHGKSLVEHVREALPSNNQLIDSFVIFIYSPTEIPDVPRVTTGIKYNDNVSLEPVAQWCYLEKPLASGLIHHANLISWNIDTGFETLQVSDEIYKAFSISRETLSDLYQKCAFVSPAQLTEPQLTKLIKQPL